MQEKNRTEEVCWPAEIYEMSHARLLRIARRNAATAADAEERFRTPSRPSSPNTTRTPARRRSPG